MREYDSGVECVKSELDLFTVPPTQTAVEEGVWDTVYANANFTTSPVIEFNIPGSNSTYIDLSQCILQIDLAIKSSGGDTINNNASVAPINNILHSLFQQVQVYLNNTPVENTNDTYHYKAYLENLLCFGNESKNTFLQNEGFYKDDAGKFDVYTFPSQTWSVVKNTTKEPHELTSEIETNVVDSNSGFVKRQKLAQKPFTVCGRIHCDIFNSMRYLLNNVDVYLKLRKKETVLMGGNEKDRFRAIITGAKIRVRRVTVAPNVMLAHSMALEKTTAKYPIKRVQTLMVNMPTGADLMVLQGIKKGVMPTRVVVGFLDQANRNDEKNPFYFTNMNIQTISLKVSSKYLPYAFPLKMDFNNNNYNEAYETLFKNIREAGNGISYADYKDGYTLFAFDLTPDLCSADHYSLIKEGSLDLEVKCSKAPPNPVYALLYMEFDSLLEITKDRSVLFDYKI